MPGALYRSKFANFCCDSMQNVLLHLPMHKKFYSNYWLKKNQTFSLFSTVKMAENYEEIGRVCENKVGLQLVLFGHFF